MASSTDSAAAAAAAASTWFRPLDADLVWLQVEAFQQLEPQLEHEWEEECHQYGQFMEVALPDGTTLLGPRVRTLSVPRRNYANPEGVVQDTSMYPYHRALYPLLDAYDALYLGTSSSDHDGADEPRHPIPSNSVQPCSWPVEQRLFAGLQQVTDFMDDQNDVVLVRSHTPVSVQCLAQTLLQKCYHCCSHETLLYLMQLALDRNQDYFNLPLTDADAQTALTGDNAFWTAVALKDIVEERNEALWVEERYGHEQLPPQRHSRGNVLLKLLRHALSEVQRDDRLASAVCVLLARHHDLDDTGILARFLTHLCSGYIACYGDCWDEDVDSENGDDHPHATHFCMERQNLNGFLVQVLAYGVTVVKEQHANTMAGFVRFLFHREFGHLLDENVDAKERRRLMLKRTAFERRMEGEDDYAEIGDRKVPLILVNSVIYAIAMRGSRERRRLKALLQSSDDGGTALEAVSLSLETYINCLRALVDIAEASIVYLPAVDRFYAIGSALIRSLCGMLADSEKELVSNAPAEDMSPDEFERNLYMGSRDPALHEKRLCTPTRLADCISHATEVLRSYDQYSSSPESSDPRDLLFNKIRHVCSCRPPDDIRDAVRSLFLRELVDVRGAYLGYSDFLVWCRFAYDVTPLDPVVFAYDTSMPCEESDAEDGGEDEDDFGRGEARIMDWDHDEDGHVLTRGEMRARYDFSLLLLLRAWQAPWTPASHLSFQPAFRRAAECVMYCIHRCAMPKEIGLHILEYLPRDAWPDERSQCWNFLCPEATRNALKRAQGHRQVSTARQGGGTPCRSCPLAVYCSEACRKADWKENHKRFCGVPPHKVLGAEEHQFIASIMGESTDASRQPAHSGAPPATAEVRNEDDEASAAAADNDEDWSDIDSLEDEVEVLTRTQQIHRFFEERTYAPRGISD